MQRKRLVHVSVTLLVAVSLMIGFIPSASVAEVTGFADEAVVSIVNVGSGKYLNVGLGYGTNGNNIYQYYNDSSTEQKFRLRYNSSDDSYYIAAMCSSSGYDKGLDVSTTASGSNARLYTISGANQKCVWYYRIERVFSYNLYGLRRRGNTHRKAQYC